MNREDWLSQATQKLASQVFHKDAPKVRVSCGFPSTRRGNRIGECWTPDASEDATSEIFIIPTISDPIRVLDILAHELCHAYTPGAGHKGAFTKIARGIGLEGKLTATVAGERLTEQLRAISEEIGPYPHGKLREGSSNTKKQTTRMLKVECPCCGYVVRTTQKWIDSGLPSCPEGTEMEVSA